MSDTTKGKTPHDGYLREHARNTNMRLEIRSADESTREIRGIASTGDIDRMNDILDPAGAVWKTPLPLLEQHDHARIIGTVSSLKRTPKGIEFAARVAKVTTPASLAERIDTVWALIRTKLLNSVSIGFRPTAWRPRDDGKGMVFEAFEILELSVVTVPANGRATIESVSEAASFTPSALDMEVAAVLARGRSTATRTITRVVRLDGGAPARPSAGVVRLTPKDWQRVKQ
ncbi:phage-like protein [Caballeronia temeraria]|uniref:Phage-like protein n=1 Tax=Caballeronia temeraria TaxID=1777137 RepID=A0A157Z6I4_9BURK|nr:HK97 family phage prohead protease [Caballeronia temeraria]SAK40607.1 phage-like protein [Caballeronia temeraria]